MHYVDERTCANAGLVTKAGAVRPAFYTGNFSFERLMTLEIEQVIARCFAEASAWIDPDMVVEAADDLDLGNLWDGRANRMHCHRTQAGTTAEDIGIGPRPRRPPVSSTAPLDKGT